MDAISIAGAGMISAAQRFDASAQRTAGGGDLVAETANQITSKTDFQASAQVLKTADKMMGTLLDMKI